MPRHDYRRWRVAERRRPAASFLAVAGRGAAADNPLLRRIQRGRTRDGLSVDTRAWLRRTKVVPPSPCARYLLNAEHPDAARRYGELRKLGVPHEQIIFEPRTER
jgi:hypothetical protein